MTLLDTERKNIDMLVGELPRYVKFVQKDVTRLNKHVQNSEAREDEAAETLRVITEVLSTTHMLLSRLRDIEKLARFAANREAREATSRKAQEVTSREG